MIRITFSIVKKCCQKTDRVLYVNGRISMPYRGFTRRNGSEATKAIELKYNIVLSINCLIRYEHEIKFDETMF